MKDSAARTKEVVFARPEHRIALPPGVQLGLCPGCGHGLVLTMLCEVIEELGLRGRAMHVGYGGCGGLLAPMMKEDWCMCSHGSATAVASGLKRAHPGSIVFAIQGDGDGLAIGMGCLVNAAARAEKITTVLLNNVNYGTTGGQLAPTTLVGQATTTSPEGRDPARDGYPIHAAELLAGVKGVAYSARGAVSSPASYQRTKKYLKTAFQRQIENVGFSYVEILSQCPTNWHMTSPDSAKWIEEELTREFPLGEFKNVAAMG